MKEQLHNKTVFKPIFLFCSICCFIAILKLPIEYYSFLRITVSLGSVLMVVNCMEDKNYHWAIVFSIIFILFNPIYPFYLQRKDIWILLDIIVGLLFLLQVLWKRKQHISEVKEATILPEKKYTRDRIISPKK